MMSGLLVDMGCSGDFCKQAVRFQELQSISIQDKPILDRYEGETCGNPGIKPPPQLKQAHAQLCTGLQGLSRELDTINVNASLAKNFLSVSSRPEQALDEVIQVITQRLEHSKQKIIQILTGLRSLDWLQPALPDLTGIS